MKKQQKIIWLIMFCIINVLILSSCWKNESTPIVTNEIETNKINVVKNQELNEVKNDDIITNSWDTITSPKQEDIVERIKNISTIDDLIKMNPMIESDEKKNNPKFIEFQKKQMLIGIAMSNIKDEKYHEIQKEISSIYEWKELLTPEIKKLDTKIQEWLKLSISSNQWEINEEIKWLIEKKNKLLQDIYKGKEFQNYIQKNQSKIDELIAEMKKYWTPEMLSLQKEVTDMSKEIYNSPEIK